MEFRAKHTVPRDESLLGDLRNRDNLVTRSCPGPCIRVDVSQFNKGFPLHPGGSISRPRLFPAERQNAVSSVFCRRGSQKHVVVLVFRFDAEAKKKLSSLSPEDPVH